MTTELCSSALLLFSISTVLSPVITADASARASMDTNKVVSCRRWESSPLERTSPAAGIQASWELACGLSEALGEAGEPLHSFNYRLA